MAADKKKPALGRGLGALIPSLPASHQETHGAAAVHAVPPAGEPYGSPRASTVKRDFFLCPVEDVGPSRDNPRQRYDEQRLSELADSIRAQGLVQPLVVRMRSAAELAEVGVPKDGPRYVLIAGERRWRAAQRAGLKDVPVVVKDVDAAAAFELALVENLQREDLNPIEEAEAYRRLSSEFGYTQEELARRVGRERTTVANSLRLLKLPSKVQEQVAVGQLSMGHARALLGLEVGSSIEQNASLVVQRQLSVRQTEELVRRAARQAQTAQRGGPKAAPKKDPAQKSASVRDVEDRLQKALGTRVVLKPQNEKAGTIEIQYNSLDELDRLLAQLCGEAD
jgi:ParB family chromosome partitioning protein